MNRRDLLSFWREFALDRIGEFDLDQLDVIGESLIKLDGGLRAPIESDLTRLRVAQHRVDEKLEYDRRQKREDVELIASSKCEPSTGYLAPLELLIAQFRPMIRPEEFSVFVPDAISKLRPVLFEICEQCLRQSEVRK